MPPAAPPSAASELSDLVAESGLRRVHLLAWRDLDDVEAGGSERHAAEVARRWAAAGVDVTVRTSHAFGHPTQVERDGYHVIRRAGRYTVFPRAVASEIIGRHGPRDGLVEIWNGVPWFGPVWARGPRIVFLHHLHHKMWEMVLPENQRLAAGGQLLESTIAPPFYRNSRIVTLSESSKNELVERLRFDPANVDVVPPGIDTQFTPGGEKSPTPLVVSVSRLMAPKRFDRVIRAAAKARHAVPDLELVIVGKGEEHERLSELIADLDAGSWVTLAGHVEFAELIDLYRRAWVLTSASVAEGWGMTITEAAACGTPAVVSDIAGHRDALIHDRSGLLCADDEQLTENLSAVLRNDALRERLTTGALARARELTWDATALATYQALADDARRRTSQRSPAA